MTRISIAIRGFVTALLFAALPAAAFAAAGPNAPGVESVAVSSDSTSDAAQRARHVIHISVDGLRADVVARYADRLTNLNRFRQEGAYTDNARTDYDYSNTLPNHTSQLTGRRVTGDEGHNWTINKDPEEGMTLHSNKGEYVASVFDVAHDNGMSTSLYTTKSKFSLFDVSYDAVNGAEDLTGEDNGRDKIDRFVYDSDSEDLVDRFVADMASSPTRYAFLHLRDPDTAGHWRSFSTRDGSSYTRAVENVDRMLGRVFELVESDPALAGNTVIILTADHGGGGSFHNHGDADDIRNYTIPFYVWGAGVAPAELYSINVATRLHPQMARPGYDAEIQPIRNADAANLALSHLGLPAVPGSTVNYASDLSSGVMPEVRFQLADRQPDDSLSGGGAVN